jgi:hypothetical protein
MREHQVNQLNNFIMGWYPENTTFCDRLIDLFNSNKEETRVGAIGDFEVVDKTIKDSVDLHINPDNFTSMFYGDHIKKLSFEYIKKWDRAKCNGMFPAEGFNIQFYPKGGGFKQWHSERESADEPQTYRHLVFMTFLNNVEDGGTEFLHQDIRIKAEKGLTLIWPAEWMFTHRGQVSYTEEKWIATGWLHHIKTRPKKE